MENPTSSASESGVKNTTTTAPTNAGTHDKLKLEQAQEYAAFVSLVLMHHGLTSEFLGPQTAKEEYDVDEQDYFRYMDQEPVIEALRAEGILKSHQKPETIILKVNDDWRDNALTPEQLKVANAMLDLVDTRSQKKKLQDLNVSTSKYQSWLKDPIFSAYLHKRAEDILGENKHEAALALMDKVRMGDTKAIQFYYELTGRYVSGGAASANTQAMDFQGLLVAILEILNDEIDDPQVAANISDRLKGLIGARNTATELVNTIVQPEVAEMRELSPRLKELMQ